MAATVDIIESEYRVNVYLDTNILLDYVAGEFPLLVKTVNYLAKCPFVYLRSSHYVLFEFTENRKARLFWEKADPDKTEQYDSKVSSNLKKSWSYKGREYAEFKDDIVGQVTTELDNIKNNLEIDFDEHVLHDGLVYPTNSLCLQTKISKEDCLVMVSCMNPDTDDYLDHCLLLTRDSQYFNAFTDNRAEVEKVFNDSGLYMPKLVRTADLKLGEGSPQYNLYDNNGRQDIENFWTLLIMKTLGEIRKSRYVGRTYTYGQTGVASKCVYFNMDGEDKTLRKSEGLYFVFNDLTGKVILAAPNEYWNGEKITLPHSNPESPKYSFMPTEVDEKTLAKLRESGNLVFYDGYVEE